MARNARTNALGLGRNDYTAGKSTLCPGCGHDSISNQIIRIAFELGLEQHNVIKMSGIGCSSKTPAYFLGTFARLQHHPRAHALRRHRRHHPSTTS